MREFINQHVAELSGTIAGFLTGIGIKVKFTGTLIAAWFIQDVHTLIMALLSGAAGGYGAMKVKQYLLKRQSNKKLKRESESE